MWKKIVGFDCWVEDGIVVRSMVDGKTVYPYRKHFDWRPDPYKERIYTWTGGWDKAEDLTIDAFRRGLKADRIALM